MIEEKQIHEYGFVKLLDIMGSDSDIASAARVSYGDGTKTVNDDRNLIRYLVRHKHTSPLEMGEVKFHLKLPIFVMRQLIRHRTANVNEYSGRYSVMSDDYYLPDAEYIQPQSTTNKQGREEGFDVIKKTGIRAVIDCGMKGSFDRYESLIDSGLSREIARTVLPVSNYTQCIWKCDLHNFLHMIRLRVDSHAQQEIQDYANAMYEMIKPHFPAVCEAWEDYSRDSVTLSRMEVEALEKLLIHEKIVGDAEDYDMSKREWKEFIDRWVNNI